MGNDHQGAIAGRQREITGLVGIGRDITKQKRNVLETIRQKQYFESLVNNSPVAIVVLDNNEKIVSSNPAFEQLYGYASKDILGENIDSLITTDETREEASRYSGQVMTERVHAVSKRKRKDGVLVDVEISAAPVLIGDEKIGALAIYHDISELCAPGARPKKPTAPRVNSLPT